nr:MAG TPA: hypothetical protein [Caudoviricetes sp.]
MTQYLGLRSLLNCSIVWLPSLLTQSMVQNLSMRTVRGV